MPRYAHAAFGFLFVGGVALACLVGPGVVMPAHARVGQGHVITMRPAQPQQNEAAAGTGLKPEVAALIKAATGEYSKLRTYQHTAEYVIKSSRENVAKETAYTLAIERPNLFCYKSDDSTAAAAICDGKVFYNLKASNPNTSKQYMRALAPASYKDLNIVDDVTFEPIATYIIALMVQGDALADADVKKALVNAATPVAVTEDGKKYETVVVTIGPNAPTTLYFDAQTHLLHKAVMKNEAENIRITEVIENVKLNQPIPPAVFQYTPPKDALLLTRALHPTDRSHPHPIITVRL
jgi:outer membrane lipoprotein-sorting protein